MNHQAEGKLNSFCDSHLVSLTQNYCPLYFKNFFFVILCHFYSYLLQLISKLFSKRHFPQCPNFFFLLTNYCSNISYQYCYSVCHYSQYRNRLLFLEWKLLAQSLSFLPSLFPQRYYFLNSKNPLLEPYQILWSQLLSSLDISCQKVNWKGLLMRGPYPLEGLQLQYK